MLINRSSDSIFGIRAFRLRRQPRDSARQAMIFHHALDVQIFQRQDIGTANQGRSGLMQEIRTACGNSSVKLGNTNALLIASVAAFLHPTQPAAAARAAPKNRRG